MFEPPHVEDAFPGKRPGLPGRQTIVRREAELLALARDRSIAGREALAASVAAMYARHGLTFTPEEGELAADILRTLIRDVERSVRSALATNLAASSVAPKDVIIALANDDIEVAFPVLTESPVLQEDELAAVVLNQTRGHRLAIAMRPSITEPGSEALSATGDQEVIICLLHNAEARISEPSLAQLVELAPGHEAFQPPLTNRPELSPDLALKLAATVSVILQNTLISRFGLDPEAVRLASMEAARHAATSLLIPQAPPLDLSIARRAQVKRMIETLRDGDWPQFLALMVRFSGLSIRLTHAILNEGDGRRLTVVCRACGISKSDFASLYLHSRRAAPDAKVVDAKDVQESLALFDRIEVRAAQSALNRWRKSITIQKTP